MFIRWSKPKYKIEIDRQAAWFWRAVSTVNGQTVATSEVYSDRAKCEQTARVVAVETGWLVVDVSANRPITGEHADA